MGGNGKVSNRFGERETRLLAVPIPMQLVVGGLSWSVYHTKQIILFEQLQNTPIASRLRGITLPEW